MVCIPRHGPTNRRTSNKASESFFELLIVVGSDKSGTYRNSGVDASTGGTAADDRAAGFLSSFSSSLFDGGIVCCCDGIVLILILDCDECFLVCGGGGVWEGK